MPTHTLLAFVAATVVLLVVPGPAVFFVVTRSATLGRRAGLVSALGIQAGTAVHTLAAMIGLSAILVASSTAFTAVKLVGAAYLIWLGVHALRSYRLDTVAEIRPAETDKTLGRIFIDGAIVNILNPKTAIFFLSFVPQFIDPRTAHPVRDVAILGGMMITLGMISDSSYALAGGWVGRRLRYSPTFRRRKDLFAGVSYIGLGTAAAVTGRP